MKHFKIKLLLIVFVFTTISCSDVLDETPDNRTSIDSAEKIAELLVAAYPEACYASFLEPMSDNAGDKGPNAESYVESANELNEDMYYWRDHLNESGDTPAYYWNNAYKAISQANQALASIEDLGGGSDLNYLKGEALLCRAYAHFMLVNMFSKTYDPKTAESDLGVPYITKPENVLIGKYKRGTVESVYNNIKSDLEKGLPLIQNNYSKPAYHFTKAAANAFASRFYLIIGEWQKVIDHASAALGGNAQTKLRNWQKEYRPLTYSEQTRRFISATEEPANLLLVSSYSLFNRFHYNARYQLNPDVKKELDFYPYKNHTGKLWSYSVYGGSGGLIDNIPKYQEYFKYTNKSAGIGLPHVTFVLLSSDEVLLNRAEAYAMMGQLDSATEDINMSYSVKTRDYKSTDAFSVEDIKTKFKVVDNTLYTPFYSIPEASLPFVNAVLILKRTIFYNEGLRWFDIKRHNVEVIHKDIENNPYVLTKTDLRRQIQIPEAAQIHGIEANPR